jgi:hypothetical protein
VGEGRDHQKARRSQSSPLTMSHSSPFTPVPRPLSPGASSAGSGISCSNHMSFGARKGRKVAFSDGPRLPTASIQRPPSNAAPEHVNSFFCTFCRTGFDKCWKWKRHEEAIHAPSRHWVCEPSFFFSKFDTVNFEAVPSFCPVCGHSFSRCSPLCNHLAILKNVG